MYSERVRLYIKVEIGSYNVLVEVTIKSRNPIYLNVHRYSCHEL